MKSYQSVYQSVLNQIGAKKYMELREHIISRTPVQVSKHQLLLAYSLGEPFFQRALEDLTLIGVNINCVLYAMKCNGWTPEAIWDAYCSNRTRRIESIISVPYSCSQKVQTLKAI